MFRKVCETIVTLLIEIYCIVVKLVPNMLYDSKADLGIVTKSTRGSGI